MTFLRQHKSSELLRVVTVVRMAKYTNCNSVIIVTKIQRLYMWSVYYYVKFLKFITIIKVRKMSTYEGRSKSFEPNLCTEEID